MVIKQMLLVPNKYSRPQTKLSVVKNIVVHYVGNPNTTALANRNYFNNLKNQIADAANKWCLNKDGSYQLYKGSKIALRWVSSHYLVGLGGEIIQCVPTDEVAYCSNQANSYSVSIECCHPDSSGKFNAATEQSLVELCTYLCGKFGLCADDIIRHYDVTGKQCPLYWSPTKYQSAAVANARFAEFKARVASALGSGGLPYKVKIKDSTLNVRINAGITYPIVYVIKQNEVYTIVEEKSVGTATWGKLKSGVGWINVGEKYVEKI